MSPAQLYAALRDADDADAALREATELITRENCSGHALGNRGLTSALHLAISKHQSPELVEKLCEAGADVNFQSQVLSLAARAPVKIAPTLHPIPLLAVLMPPPCSLAH